jgi:LysR family glycine cleavage system transcriptional activator
MDWRPIPSLSALRAFEAMARLGGLSAAARELNVTHAAIAQHIRYLEDFLTVKLAYREGNGMRLTPSGSDLSKALQDGFKTIAGGIRSVKADHEARPLQITLTPGFAENWLMPRLGSFWAEHPEVELSLNPSTKLVDLVAGDIDLAIRFGQGAWTGLLVEKLVGAGYCIVGQSELMGTLAVKSPEDLLSAPWLLQRQIMEPEHILKLQGLDLAQSTITRFATNSLVLAAARTGLGLTIQAESLVDADIAEGRLVCIKRIHCKRHGYYLVRPQTAGSAKLTTFIAWLKRSL